MKNMSNKKMKYAIRVVSVLCMIAMFMDTVLIAECNYVKKNAMDETYSEEEYSMDAVYADGKYDGNGSDKWKQDVEGGTTDDSGKKILNIVEILPTSKAAAFGYLISGIEPFDLGRVFAFGDGDVYDQECVEYFKNYGIDEEFLRASCMDALINPAPGVVQSYTWKEMKYSEYGNWEVTHNENNVYKMDVGIDNMYSFVKGMQQPSPFHDQVGNIFNLNCGEYDGYYLYVGSGKGLYALAQKSDSDHRENNYVMVSKFYDSGHLNITGARDAYSNWSKMPNIGSGCTFDYIWVPKESDLYDENAQGLKIVKQKRNKYSNNDVFFNYLYSGSRDEYKVSLYTNKPENLDIEKVKDADLFVLESPVSGSDLLSIYKYAVEIHNLTIKNNEGIDKDAWSMFGSGTDISDEIRDIIYKKVIQDEDAAIIATKNSYKTSRSKNKSRIQELIEKVFDFRSSGDADNAKAYKNRIYIQENDLIKKNNSGEYWIKSALELRDRKLEEGRKDGFNKFVANINIVNGDGANYDAKNKTLYVNKYEMDTIESIPVKLKIKSSENIEKILIYRNDDWYPLIEYKAEKEDNIGDSSIKFVKGYEYRPEDGPRTANFTINKDDSKTEVIEGSTKEVYTFGLDTDDGILQCIRKKDLTGVNTTIKIRLYIVPNGSFTPAPDSRGICSNIPDTTDPDYIEFTDEITIAVRDFFQLN